MRTAIAIVVAALVTGGCIDPVASRWELDHDHVVAVRANPPAVLPGDRAELDALVAHDGGPATVEIPAEAAILDGPEILRDLVYTDGGRWFVFGAFEPGLDIARAELGLPAGAPVPVEVYAAFGEPGQRARFARKRVWLGITRANPPPPQPTIDGAPMLGSAVVPIGVDVYLSVPVAPGERVSWLSSVGTVFQDDVATSFLRVLPEDPRSGELAVVVRDEHGGVAWRVAPLEAVPPAP